MQIAIIINKFFLVFNVEAEIYFYLHLKFSVKHFYNNFQMLSIYVKDVDLDVNNFIIHKDW